MVFSLRKITLTILITSLALVTATATAADSSLPDACQVKPGDMNSDTTINVLDVVALVNKILTGNNSGLTACDECFAAIAPDQNIDDYDECRVMGDDTNGDELLNVLDAVSLVSFVLGTSTSDFLAADSLCTACHESLTACDSCQFDCL